MKFLSLILTLVLAVPAFAGSYKVPEDAVIKVFDKNGKQIGEMSRKEYKVVKIEEKKPAPIVVTKAQKKVVDKYEKGYNSIIVHAGVGNDGLRNRNNGSAYIVEERQRPVGGLTYCRNQKSVGICGSFFTNDTATLGIKKDF